MKIVYLKNLRWLRFSVLLMLLDIGSKYWIITNFFIGEKLFISSYCNFYYICNAGLAFGLLSNVILSYRCFFIWTVIFVIVAFIIILCKSVRYFGKYLYCAYSMIIGGALGNLYDRILYGTVIDFIDIHINNWHWPTFNIADVEICIGVFILIVRHFCIVFKNNSFNEF